MGQDQSAETYCSVFEQAGQAVLGMESKDLHELEKNNDKLAANLKARYFTEQFSLTLRCKQENFNGEDRPKNVILSAKKWNDNERSSAVLSKLAAAYPAGAAKHKAEINSMLDMVKELGERIQLPPTMSTELTRLAAVVA